MKIKISKIDEAAFTVREKLDPEYLTELKDSMKEDGQWDAILVRPVGDKYELIAGHNRTQAAKELGWTEIEANVKDLNDTDAMFLSLKTNMLRQDMTPMEQGKVLNEIMQKHPDISGKELSRKLGKHENWVGERVRIALKLHKSVTAALESEKITFKVAQIIGSLEPHAQEAFLLYILENKITKDEDVLRSKRRFLNNTIYTIGYEGKEIQPFIDQLKAVGIESLIDVRFSAESQFKPDFNKAILARELERAKIKYTHRPDLGVPHEWQNPYKDGAVPVECLEKYYKWHTEKELDFKKFITDIKDTGKTALMCFEKYARPTRDQKIYCHRHILANLVMETKEFKERIDL